jgi:hypothetical protein
MNPFHHEDENCPGGIRTLTVPSEAACLGNALPSRKLSPATRCIRNPCSAPHTLRSEVAGDGRPFRGAGFTFSGELPFALQGSGVGGNRTRISRLRSERLPIRRQPRGSGIRVPRSDSPRVEFASLRNANTRAAEDNSRGTRIPPLVVRKRPDGTRGRNRTFVFGLSRRRSAVELRARGGSEWARTTFSRASTERFTVKASDPRDDAVCR